MVKKAAWHVVRIGVCLLFPCLEAHAAGIPQVVPTPNPDEPAAIAWIQASATPFSDTTPSDAEFQPFLTHLEGSRIIGIGEATHGDHQDQAFKAELIRVLIKAGRIDTLALECNRQAASGFNAYVVAGKGDPVALIMAPGFFSIWRDDEFADLLLWIRAWNTTAVTPVHIIGVDDQDSGTDTKFALDFIVKRNLPLAKKLTNAVAPLIDGTRTTSFYDWMHTATRSSYDVATKGIDAIVDALDHHPEWQSVEGFSDARYAARVAAQGMQVFELEAGVAKPDYSSFPAEYWNRRDVFMAANLVARTESRHHAALWAHDDHVLSELDKGATSQGQVSMGSELRRLIGKDYVSIGFAWSKGSFNARLIPDGGGAESALGALEPRTLSNDLQGDLGHVLEQVGPDRFWIDLRHYPTNLETWGKTFYFRGWAGFAVNQKFWDNRSGNRTTLLPSHDILVYFKRITPSHLWPVSPPMPSAHQ